VWIGKDDNSPVGLTGSQGALATFIDLQSVRKAQSISKPLPSDVKLVYFDPETKSLMEEDCGEVFAIPIAVNKIPKLKACPSVFDWFD
jgi:penicillin-binding protein 1B